MNFSYDKYDSDNDDVLNEDDSNFECTDDTLDKTQPSTIHIDRSTFDALLTKLDREMRRSYARNYFLTLNAMKFMR